MKGLPVLEQLKQEIHNKGISDFNALLQYLQGTDYDLESIMEHKDVLSKWLNYTQSKENGEYFTNTEVSDLGLEYLKALEITDLSKYNIWDATCGSGNLLADLQHDNSRLFLSTLLAEDVEIVNTRYTELQTPAFQLDFLNGLDLMAGMEEFSNKLPFLLRKKLQDRESFIFYMNPPYCIAKATDTDVGCEMCSKGLKSSAINLYIQCFYRVLSIVEYYKLTDVYICMFCPPTFMYAKRFSSFMEYLGKTFKFQKGFLIGKNQFEGVNNTRDMNVSFTIWKYDTDSKEANVVLDEYVVDNGELSVKNINTVDVCYGEKMHDWIKPKESGNELLIKPMVSSAFKAKGLRKMSDIALGQIMSDYYVTKGVNFVAISTLPCLTGVDITKENFIRCMLSHTIRCLYKHKDINNRGSARFDIPKFNKDNEKQWIADSLIYAASNKLNINIAYREFVCQNEKMVCGNFLFTLKKEVVSNFNITDDLLKRDLAENQAKNSVFMGFLDKYSVFASAEAKKVLECENALIKWSLENDVRSKNMYKYDTQAWDASVKQLLDLVKYSKDTEGEILVKEFEQAFKAFEEVLVKRVDELEVL